MAGGKKGGGRQFSASGPNMRAGGGGGGGGGGRSSGGGGGKRGGSGGGGNIGLQARVHGEAPAAKKRVRSSRAQNAYGDDADDAGESAAHVARAYDADAAAGREYRLPEQFE